MLWIILLLAILAILNKKSKKVALLLFILMFILMGFNTGNADYSMYNTLFYKYGRMQTYLNTEIIFQYLCKLVYSFGKGYNYFLCLYSLVGMSFMYLTVRKTAKYPALVALLYLGFSFFLDAVQIRHFMASSIVCYGLTFLLKEDRKKIEIFKYIILNILAVGFHFMAIFYFLFLLLPFLENKKLKNTLIKVIIPTCVIFLVINSNIFLGLLSYIIPKTKIEAYFLSGNWKVSTGVTIILILVQLIPLFILWFSKYHNESKLVKRVIILNILLILVTPFYFYTVEFGRIFRGIIIYDYIALTNLYNKKTKYKITFMSLLMVALLFISLILVVGLYEKTVQAILINNMIF